MSFPPSFCFIQIPRTASGSMASVLNVPHGGHKPAVKIRKRWGDWWDEMFTFAFVRHPIDRFISGYYHIKKQLDWEINFFLKWHGIEELIKTNEQIFRPETDYICDGDKIIVDFVGIYESLPKDWNKVAKRLKIKQELPCLNKGPEVDVGLTRESQQVLRSFYAKDFKVLNYK